MKVYRGAIVAVSNLSDRLIWARKEAKLSQPALAKAAGVSQGTIGNLESGARQNPRSLLRIAAALKVSPDWLLTGKGPARPGEPAHKGPAAWPFERITPARWEALSERQRGVVEDAAVKAIRSLEQDAVQDDQRPPPPPPRKQAGNGH